MQRVGWESVNHDSLEKEKSVCFHLDTLMTLMTSMKCGCPPYSPQVLFLPWIGNAAPPVFVKGVGAVFPIMGIPVGQSTCRCELVESVVVRLAISRMAAMAIFP